MPWIRKEAPRTIKIISVKLMLLIIALPLALSHETGDKNLTWALSCVISDKFTGRTSFPSYFCQTVIRMCTSRFVKAINLKERWYSKLLIWHTKFPRKLKEICYSEWLSTTGFDSQPRQSGRGTHCYNNKIEKGLRNCNSLIHLMWGSESFRSMEGLTSCQV